MIARFVTKLTRRAAQLVDPRFRAFYRQRRVRDLPARERAADRVASRLPCAPEPSPSASAAAAKLATTGFAMTPGIVTPGIANELRAYFRTQHCSDPYRPHLGSFQPPDDYLPGVHVAYFDAKVVARAPHIFAIMNHPTLLGAAGMMLGATPTLSYMATWWSLPAGDGKGAAGGELSP